MDLLDWLRGRHPWAKLLRLADRLPRHSRYIAALYDDDELAPLLVAAHDNNSGEEPRMSMVGWSPERELLTEVLQAVRGMHATLIGVNSKNGKAPDVPPARRPTTAVDLVRRRQNEDECARITALFSPRPTDERVAS